MRIPIVAVPADIRHFDSYDWHAVPSQYLNAALHGAGVLPLLVPAFETGVDVDAILDRVDGVLVTGSRTNVHPSHYGAAETAAHKPFDRARDAVSLALIRAAVEQGVPLLAICRGIQELNVALGGTLDTEIHEIAGRMDHRKRESDDQDVIFGIRHDVTVTQGSCLAGLLGTEKIAVNSVHRQAIGQLAPRLVAEAIADDGTVEAVSVKDAPGFAVGVQWHPEYWYASDAPSAALFRGFGDVVRDYASSRPAGREREAVSAAAE